MKNCLHIYPQGAWHDDVLIVGTFDAIQLLRLAIGDALGAYALTAAGHPAMHNPAKTQQDIFVNDGEGYSVRVLCVDEVPVNLAVPYTEDMAKENRENAVWPDKLFQKGQNEI